MVESTADIVTFAQELIPQDQSNTFVETYYRNIFSLIKLR